MEIDESLKFFSAYFCNEDKLLKYLIEFRNILQNTDHVIEFQKTENFLSCVIILEKSCFFNSLDINLQCISVLPDDFFENLNDVILSILEIFCFKYQKILLERQHNQDISRDVITSFDTIAYLVQLLISKIGNKGYISALLENMCCYFVESTKSMSNIYASSVESASNSLYYYTLKLLTKIIKAIPDNCYFKYISDTDILQLVNSLPFPDITTVKLFINHILPALFQFSSPSLKDEILKSMWNMVYAEFKKEDSKESSESSSYIYTMVYCVSAYIYNSNANETVNFYVHTDIIFWQLILSGLTSSLPFVRKKSLNIFKMFLIWIKQCKKRVKVSNDVSLLPMDVEAIKIWNDVVTIFESLEEKQIHVIKPVLPKFSRILSLTTKGNFSTDENNARLISAWVLAVITRMLKHETKFVTRWALVTVLSFDFKEHILHEDSLKMLIKILLESFNDQSLFSKNSEQDNYSLFLSSEKISKFFKKYLAGLESPREKVAFFRYLLNIIASQSWCIVALLHITVALSTLESTASWNKSDISLIRNIVVDCQRSHEPAFRASLEYFMMECCILFLDWNSLQIADLVELLSVFKSTAVSRHSKPWNNFASRIHYLISNKSSGPITQAIATEFCTKNIAKVLEIGINEAPDAEIEEMELGKVAKILMLFADASVISIETTGAKLNWISLLNPVISTIQFASSRPYMHSKKFLSSVKLITLLIKESYGCDKIELDPHTTSIVASLNNYPEIIKFLYQKLFINIDSTIYISQNCIIFEFFDSVIKDSRLNSLFLPIIPHMIKKVEDILEDEKYRRHLLFSLWKILVILVDDGLDINLTTTVHSINYRILSKVLNYGILQECLPKPASLDCIRKEQRIQFFNQSVCNFWHVIYSVILHLSDDEVNFIMLPLIVESEKVFNNGPKTAIPYTIRSLKKIIPRLGKHNLCIMSELLELAWKSCLELRGNEAFRPSLSSLIEIIFQLDMMQEPFFSLLDKYFKYFKQLSEGTSGIFYTFIKQFCSTIPLNKLLESGFNCLDIFVFALTFGPIHQKAHKIMEDTLFYLLEQDPHLTRSLTVVDSNKPPCYVRIRLLEYLLESLKEETKESEDFVFLLIQELMKADSDDDSKPTSHFANSLSHRIRNRAWQSVLLIQHFIKDKALNEQLLLKTLNALGAESQQPSIRYLQEWVVFNILHVERSFIEKFILIMNESLHKRPSYIISIVSITNLLILHQIMNSKSNLTKCFKLLTIFCMAQNFTVRLYAQVTLTNLFNLCKQMKISSIISQYEFVSQMIDMQASMEEGHGNFFKNVKKLSNDFYFSTFNPINHFSLETVLYDLPRLSNISPDEWIRPDWFSRNCFHVLTYNLDDNLKKSLPTSWSSKMLNDNTVSENDSLDYNFQKKIIPIKDIIEDNDDLVLKNLEAKQFKKDGLIVVASLIDRIPNLGGLCRTCEVFGVSELVIGSLQYTNDKQFQTLAVSADKWVTIKEVKPYMLKGYLTSMKEKGYTLVGAEQTEDSCNLKEYQFPKKSVLLLGHEKEGLPVDLIQLLDVCVEIPQQGVVRSLNVHVSGAILIWEYVRQHNSS